MSTKHLFTAISNGLSFWAHENISIPIKKGVDEIALALVADTYSRTYRSKAFSLAPVDVPVTTQRGLMIVPDRVQGVGKPADRTVELRSDLPPVASLDATLQEIEQLYGSGTAAFLALQLEYPR
ncbi:MAG: hypothetical protein AAFV72_24450 [Cyanobacteria bacterium J06635_1]